MITANTLAGGITGVLVIAFGIKRRSFWFGYL